MISGLWEQMKLTDMNQFLATQTLKNQDLIKDILLILTDVIFCSFYVDKMTEKVGAALFIVVVHTSL